MTNKTYQLTKAATFAFFGCLLLYMAYDITGLYCILPLVGAGLVRNAWMAIHENHVKEAEAK